MQRTNNQQEKKVDNMDYDAEDEYPPDCDLEEWASMRLDDETLKITFGRGDRVTLNMSKASLKEYLDEPSDSFWDFQIHQLKEGIRNLKYKLNEAQAINALSVEETGDLKQQLEDQSVLLQKAQHELEQQTSNDNNTLKTENQALENALAFERNRVTNLEQKLVAMEEAFRKQMEEQKAETRKITSALKKAEDLLETQLLCLQEKTSIIEETQKSKFVFAAQLEEQTQMNNTNVAALKNAEQQLSNYRSEWQKDKTSLMQYLHTTLAEKDRTMELKEASHQAKMEEQKAELQKSITALEKAEDLLEIERLCLQDKTILLEKAQKSNTLLVAQLEEQRQANDTVVAALRTAEQQVESYRSEWQKDKTSIVLASETLKKTLEEKEAEWVSQEAVLKTKIEDLLAYIARKKKKKWWRKFIPNSTITNRDVHN